MQKILVLLLVAVIAFFQYELWYGHGGIYDQQRLQDKITKQAKLNQQLQERNDEVNAHIHELKGSPEFMEARARRELNLVRPNETLVILPSTVPATILTSQQDH